MAIFNSYVSLPEGIYLFEWKEHENGAWYTRSAGVSTEHGQGAPDSSRIFIPTCVFV